MRIGLIPLDERPANTRYPAMIAGIAGVNLLLPPPELLSSCRTPARCDALGAWTRDVAGRVDALIVSCEMLGYGGLIASRTTDEPVGTVVRRLDVLRQIKRRHPSLVIFGFNLITRVPDADNAFEEPEYWEHSGRRLYRLSQLLDRQARGEPVDAELEVLRAELDARYVQDLLWRRLRNHTVNLAVLEMLSGGVLDLLVLSSDDTSAYGLGSREKGWLAEWAGHLGLGDRLLMYPGADEVGCALLARLINAHAGSTPSFEPCYAVPEGERVVAPYEDVPVAVTVERQVRAVGGSVVREGADVWLAINPPVSRRGEWHGVHAQREREERLPYLEVMVGDVCRRQAEGRRVVVADVAYPNGSDPALVDLLRERVELTALAAYGGWNTAGNTIGTALAQGCAALRADTDERRAAQEMFLLHRFVEDWGYQHTVRAQVRGWIEARTGGREPVPEMLPETAEWIEKRLRSVIDELPGFEGRWEIARGSVRLPWGRTFEVDFDLRRVVGAGRARP